MPSHTHTLALGFNSASVFGHWLAQGTVNKPLVHSHSTPATGDRDRQAVHSHAVATDLGATGAGTALPAYREVVLCQNTRDDLYAAPAGAIALGDGACPSGWDEAPELQGRMIRGHDGDAVYREVGGSDGHAHALGHDHAGVTADSDVSSYHYHLNMPATAGLQGTAANLLEYSCNSADLSPGLLLRYTPP